VIRAVTFDLWNTLYADQPELEAERDRWRIDVLGAATGEGPAAVRAAIEATRVEWYRVWRSERRTPPPPSMVAYFARVIGIELDEDARAETLRGFQEATLVIPPRPIPGALEVVREVAASVPIALISDTGFTPGRILRRVLAADGVLDLFVTAVFSDETGVAKPDPRAFHTALESLGTEAAATVHIGDLVETDVAGAKGVGMRAVLYRARGSAPAGGPAPDAVVESLADLPGLIAAWSTPPPLKADTGQPD